MVTVEVRGDRGDPEPEGEWAPLTFIPNDTNFYLDTGPLPQGHFEPGVPHAFLHSLWTEELEMEPAAPSLQYRDSPASFWPANSRMQRPSALQAQTPHFFVRGRQTDKHSREGDGETERERERMTKKSPG